MTNNDIRWQQRFDNYTNALVQLKAAVETYKIRPLNQLEAMGLIQAFEFTYELGWKVLKDYLHYQGYPDLVGSRDTIREAVNQGVMDEEDGSLWLRMLKDRNRSSHLYDEKAIRSLETVIVSSYFSAFEKMKNSMEQRIS